jgi:hypothetical protein
MEPFAGGELATLTAGAIFTRLGIIFALAFALAFVVESALDGIFTYRRFKSFFDAGYGVKYPIAVLCSYLVCSGVGVDLIVMLTTGNLIPSLTVHFTPGLLLMAFFVARGSKYVATRFGELKQQVEKFS